MNIFAILALDFLKLVAKELFTGLEKTFDLRGRSFRSEYWSYFLIQAFVGITSILVYRASNDFWKELLLPTLTLYLLGSFLSLLTIQLRRVRDSLGSGWWWIVLYALILMSSLLSQFIDHVVYMPFALQIMMFFICLAPSKAAKRVNQ